MTDAMNRTLLNEILKYDPFAVAEAKYGDREDTQTLMDAMSMFREHSEIKTNALREMQDSYMQMPFEKYRGLVSDLGFVEVLVEPFLGRSDSEGDRIQETLVAAWSPGMLLIFSSFDGEKVNSASLMFNYRAPSGASLSMGSSSPYFDARGEDGEDEAYVKEHGLLRAHDVDVREGLRNTLIKIGQSEGHLVSPWLHTFVYTISCYGDDYDENGERIFLSDAERRVDMRREKETLRRWEALPDHVKAETEVLERDTAVRIARKML